MSLLKKYLYEYIPWIMFIAIMSWIQVSLTGILSNTAEELRDIIGYPTDAYINTLIPLTLLAGIILNTSSFLSRRLWIAYFSTLSISVIDYLILYSLIYRRVVDGTIPYQYFSDLTESIFFNLFLGLVPVILFNYILNITRLRMENISFQIGSKIYIPIELIFSITTTIGLAIFFLYLNNSFGEAIRNSLSNIPKEIQPLISNLLDTNLGFLIIMTIFISLITFIIYSMVEPITIYIGGFKSQAVEIIIQEYRTQYRRLSKVIKPRLVYNLLYAIPYMGLGVMVILYNFLYLQDLYIQFGSATPLDLILNIFKVYYIDISTGTHIAQPTTGDITLSNLFNLADIERYIEFIRALIRFFLRLVF